MLEVLRDVSFLKIKYFFCLTLLYWSVAFQFVPCLTFIDVSRAL